MFELKDKVKVWAGEYKDKEGIVISKINKIGEIPIVVLKLKDKSEIKVLITDL